MSEDNRQPAVFVWRNACRSESEETRDRRILVSRLLCADMRGIAVAFTFLPFISASRAMHSEG